MGGHRADVRHQFRGAVAARPGDRDGLGHQVVTNEGGIDLTELDPEATHLDLAVGTPEELQLTGRCPTHEVAGAVHAVAVAPEWVGQERLRRAPYPSVVSARQVSAGEVQLADGAGRYRLKPFVQNQQIHASYRPADAQGLIGCDRVGDGGSNGGFGGAVGVEQPTTTGPSRDDLGVGMLATDDHRGQGRQGVRFHGCQHRRRDERVRDRLVGEHVLEFVAAENMWRSDHHGRGSADRHEDLEDGGVEARRSKVQCDAVGLDTEPLHLFGREVDQAVMTDHHTLRHTGGPGGVDEIRRVVQCQWADPVV